MSIPRNRRILYAVAGAVILMVGVISLLALTEMRQLAQTRNELVTQNMARLMEQTYDGLIDTIDVSLQTSADEITRQMSAGIVDQQQINQFFQHQLARVPKVNYFRATNEKGQIVFGPGVISPPVDLSDRDFFIQLRDNPKFGLFVGNAIFGRTEKHWIWYFARRINGPNGGFAGVIYASIYVEEIDRMLAEVTLNAGDVATLRDADLGVIARHVFPNANPIPPGDKKLAKPFEQALKLNPIEGTYFSGGSSIDDISRTQSYRRSKKYQYYVNVGISNSGALELWRKQLLIVCLLLMAFVIITIAFARFIDRAWLRQNADIEAVRHANDQFQTTLDAIPDLLFEVDRHGRVIQYRASRSDLLATPSEVFIGKTFVEVLPPEAANVCMSALKEASDLGRSSGGLYSLMLPQGETWFELSVAAMPFVEGQERHFVVLARDITERKLQQSQLEHIAHFDALTNLPNRLLLADRLQQAMVQSERRGQKVALAYLDLDGFKAVNDQFGHDVGDQLLIHLAAAMKATLREGDTLARLGGDEFVAVLIDLDSVESCYPMLDRLLEAGSIPMHWTNRVGDTASVDVLQASVSIGVSLYPQAFDIEANQLLRQADQAMYQAKLAGKNRYFVFDAIKDSSVRAHHESLERIRLALVEQEFVLHYQPKVNMRSGEVIGVEALIRWQHPDRGLLPPSSFLPGIEDHSLSVDVGEWVMEAALIQMETWASQGVHLPVSINIGARQLQQSNFFRRLKSILEKHPRVNPRDLELEVLETSALADMEQVSRLIADCAELGIKFALDDFGTGYSSLTYLKRLRVAQLKIDQSFVRDMLEDPDDLAILQGIIGLAKAFKREVIAEGVETVEHGTALLQLGCDLGQGFGIARPMSPEQLPDWVGSWRPDAAWGML